MNCIIVDDDAGCINTLETILQKYVTGMRIAGSAANINGAVKLINEVSPDVVFLDVELGNEMGFDIFKYFSSPNFKVVFTTAHEKYALKAIKSSCYDFLLKPVNIQEVVNVTDRLIKEKNIHQSANAKILLENINSGNSLRKIAVPSAEGYLFVDIEDIVSLQGEGKYTNITTTSGQRSVSIKNIGEFEELLDPKTFFRTHKSWIINLKHVKKFLRSECQVLLTNDIKADVSTRKKDDFLKLFGKV